MGQHTLITNKENLTKNWLLILGIIFVAFNLRSAITAVGPIIGFIRTDIGISNGTAGLLTTLPLLAFAMISPLAPKISQRLGSGMTVFIGLVMLGIGIFVRSSGMLLTLMIGTLLIGVGIAVCN